VVLRCRNQASSGRLGQQRWSSELHRRWVLRTSPVFQQRNLIFKYYKQHLNQLILNLNHIWLVIATGLEEAARNAASSNQTTWQPLLAMLMLLWMRLTLRAGVAWYQNWEKKSRQSSIPTDSLGHRHRHLSLSPAFLLFVSVSGSVYPHTHIINLSVPGRPRTHTYCRRRLPLPQISFAYVSGNALFPPAEHPKPFAKSHTKIPLPNETKEDIKSGQLAAKSLPFPPSPE